MFAVSEEAFLTFVAMLCITILEALNMVFFGVDSTVLNAVVAVLAGLAGYKVKAYRARVKKGGS